MKEYKSQGKKWLFIPFIVFIIGMISVGVLGFHLKRSQEELTRTTVELNAMTYANRMRQDIKSGIDITKTLEQVIICEDGAYDKFSQIAGNMMTDTIQSIQLAPDGVVTEIYPEQGNEAGKIDLIHDKDRGEISRYARDYAVMIMQGPFELNQGGYGIAVRNPVYLEQEDGQKVFWGFTIVIIRVPEIFSDSIEALSDFGYDYRLSKTVSPLDESYQEVYSSGTTMKDAVSYTFNVGDSSWILEISPQTGWYNARNLYLIMGGCALIVCILAGFTYVLLNFSEQKSNMNQELSKALEAAEAASLAKTNFLNNMSHDIRTPLNAILGYTKLLSQEEECTEKIGSYLGKIENSGQYLLSIINNVLDMARIESGRMTLDEEFHEINAKMSYGELFAAYFSKKNITFRQITDIEHHYVFIDITKMEQVIINLVSNAVKYTPDGGHIVLEVKELPCEKAGYAKYVISVSDDGIGMSEEFQKHMFDAFSRERDTTESKIVGTGLGLSIVKKLVDLMGGTIEAESRQGEGSTFRVTVMPRIAETPENYLKGGQSDEPKQELLEGKRILLAEDNDLNAEIAQEIMENMGLKVERAEDGIRCIDMLQKADAGYYDLILMDIQMPNLNGHMAAEKIRRLPDPAKANIPIIAMTANAFEEDRKKALEAGMNGHLTKPVEIPKLLEMLAAVLK